MDDVQIVTELWLRRGVMGLERPNFVGQLQTGHGGPSDLDQWTVYRWEIRRHEPCPIASAALCRCFDVTSIATLGLGHTPEADANWTLMAKAERRREVDRRKLLRRGVEIAVAVLPVGPLVQAAQLSSNRRQVDPGMLDLSEQTATHLATTYVASPGGEAVAAAVAHARSLTKLVTGARMTDASKTRPAAIASDAAALVGHTHLNDGRIAEADAWLEHALALARQAGDRRLEALTIASTAFTCCSTPKPLPSNGNRDEALAALQAAAAYDPGSGRVLERALQAAARVDREDPGWGLLVPARATVRLGRRPGAGLRGAAPAVPGPLARRRPLAPGRTRRHRRAATPRLGARRPRARLDRARRP